MKRAMVLLGLLVAVPNAHADSRDKWQVTFAASVTTTVIGGYLWVHGQNQIDDAKQQLCDGGAYHESDPSCPDSVGGSTLTQADIDRLNDKGDRGQMLGRIGLLTTAVSGVLVGVSLYKGFIAPAPKRESRVTITPTVGRSGGGALVQIAF